MPGENQLVPFDPTSLSPSDPRDRRITAVKNIEIGEIDAFGQFRAVWDLLVKHQWLILTVTVVLTALVAFYSFKCSRFTKPCPESMWNPKRRSYRP